MEDIVIALASKAFVNGDVSANLSTMLETMAEAAGRGAALVCFGEAFLQGSTACAGTTIPTGPWL